jgi:hypothetical protein
VCCACAVPLDRRWLWLTLRAGSGSLWPRHPLSLRVSLPLPQDKQHRNPDVSCWLRTEKAYGSFRGWPRAPPSRIPPTAAWGFFATRLEAPCPRTDRKQASRRRLLHRLVRCHSMHVAILCAQTVCACCTRAGGLVLWCSPVVYTACGVQRAYKASGRLTGACRARAAGDEAQESARSSSPGPSRVGARAAPRWVTQSLNSLVSWEDFGGAVDGSDSASSSGAGSVASGTSSPEVLD